MLVVVGLLVAPAWASAVTTDCAGLPAALSGATPGETIDLTELCTGASASFTLPTATGVTIEGAATDLGGFGAMPGANVTATNSDVCAIGTRKLKIRARKRNKPGR